MSYEIQIQISKMTLKNVCALILPFQINQNIVKELKIKD